MSNIKTPKLDREECVNRMCNMEFKRKEKLNDEDNSDDFFRRWEEKFGEYADKPLTPDVFDKMMQEMLQFE